MHKSIYKNNDNQLNNNHHHFQNRLLEELKSTFNSVYFQTNITLSLTVYLFIRNIDNQLIVYYHIQNGIIHFDCYLHPLDCSLPSFSNLAD